MKNVIFSIAIAIIGLISCDREQVCTCEFYAANAPTLTLVADTSWIIEGKSFKQALVDCRDENGFEKSDEITESCDLD